MESLNINQKTIAWLNSAKGISNKKIKLLIDYFNQSPKNLWESFEDEKYNLTFLKPEIISYLTASKYNFEETFLNKLADENSSIVTIYDTLYPKKLKHIEGAPYILYYKGSLNNIDDLSIAVVGSRKATAYGKWVTEKLTRELSNLGVNIISGLAAGIDTIAHKTALKNNSNTFGVIGSGIDIVYPKSNEHLYKEIAEKGAVITEYPFGMQPMPNNFHARNRIISGLSDGVLVIEAQEKSGTLITAGHAADQGREIFAVPGNIDSLYSKGTNLLIKDGAKITTSIEDVVDEILELKNKMKQRNNILNYNNMTQAELKIINCLQSGNRTVYEIIEETKIEISTTLSLLTLLEMKELIKPIEGNKFSLNQ